MPKPHLKKRTYGYLGGESEEDAPRKSTTRITQQGPSPILRIIGVILLFPFRVLSWIFRGTLRTFDRRPRLSGETSSRIGRTLVRLTIIGIGVALVGGVALVAWVSKDLPDPDKLTDRQVAQSTKIYDRTGQHLLYEVFADKKRTVVNLDQIPKHLVNGLIATEDTQFYSHHGVRPLSIARSVVYGLLGKGTIGGGASTITQQLIKNTIVGDERRGFAGLFRKLKEGILAVQLEQKYTKNQILKIYFNEIPYGSTNYGVESAAQSYFGKSVSELSLAESATLAGFPKAPSKYLNNTELLKTRRNFVLARMAEEGYITKAERDAAQAEPIELKQSAGALVAPHFVQYVKEQLSDMYGEQQAEQGGLKVITTLNWDKQSIAEKAVKDNESLLEGAGANNTALVALDPRNGQIVAMVGSRDFNRNDIDGKFDVVRYGRLQPGSSFKPIIYAAAFEKGYTPDTILFDVTTNFALSGTPYIPKNYDFKERGPVTIRQALQGSLNVPAVQTLYLVGETNAYDFAERLGYGPTLRTSNCGLSLVLGCGGVTLLEHTSAYATFANNGVRRPIVSILSVEAPDGDRLFEWRPTLGEPVLAPEVTATLSNVLSDDPARQYVFGVGSNLTLPGRPVAAKTGTTQGYKDAWTMGYTPSLAAGVWAGNSSGAVMKAGNGGNKIAGQIWNQFMRESLKDTPVEQFPTAPANTAQKPILRGTLGGSVTLDINKFNGRIATSSTPPELIETKTYIPAHSILHYVHKNDPQGPVPTDPSTDPQYTVWEQAIAEWIARQEAATPDWKVDFSEPPTQYDTPTDPTLAPSLEILSPTSNTVITNRFLTISLNVSAPRGVSKVTYVIDQMPFAIQTTPPFSLSQELPNLTNTVHTLTIIAEDDLGNATTKTVPLNINIIQ